MKLYLDCIPCFQRQALFATKNLSEQTRESILRKVIILLTSSEWNITPDELSQKVNDLVREETGIDDPYQIIKKESNEEALKFYSQLKLKIEKIEDVKEKLYTAVKLAIAGNIIDFGPQIKIDLEATINNVLHNQPEINDFDRLYNDIFSARNLLYFADNAGEIVFDKILIEEMIAARGSLFDKISFVIKGMPMINDAMLDDIQETGLDKLPNIEFLNIGNGNNDTGPKRRDKEVKQWIKHHELIISKGQGNFEGFSPNDNICFLLIAKCPVIAGELGVHEMDTIIKYH